MAVLLWATGCGGEREFGHEECSEQYLSKGTLVDEARFPFVVRVVADAVSCTGTIIGDHIVLVAAHCVTATTNRVVIRRGASCIDGATPCRATPLRTFLHPALDVAVLRTDAPLAAGWQTIGLASEERFDEFELLGYGHDGIAKGADSRCSLVERPLGLTAGRFSKHWEDDRYFGAFAQDGGPSVCAGDSGGPAVRSADGSTSIVGLAVGSDSDQLGGLCTPVGGFQLFLRTSAFADWAQTQSR